MSFLKNLTKGFNELKAKFSDDDPKAKSVGEAKRAEADGYYQSQQSAPQGGHSSGLGAPTQAYGAPPPAINAASGAPPCPPGWTAQWDQNSQRWFYVEQATGRSTWDSPNPGHSDQRGLPGHGGAQQYGMSSQGDGSHGAPFGGAPQYGAGGYGNSGPAQYGSGPQYGQPGYGQDMYQEKKKGGNNAMLYGAGGLAAGAVGGALIANELNDNDNHGSGGQSQNYGGGQGGYGAPAQGGYGDPAQGGYGAPPAGAPPGALPATDADGDSVSGSDREEVQDARADYEEAVAEASAGDSSDEEEVQEAREEYEEAYEETYED